MRHLVTAVGSLGLNINVTRPFCLGTDRVVANAKYSQLTALHTINR